MSRQQRPESARNGGVTDFIWNIIGGMMVSAMLAGMMYLLVGSMGKFLNGNDSLWELSYLKWYFIAILIVYMVMPTVLANVIGFIFGSRKKSSGKGQQRASTQRHL